MVVDARVLGFPPIPSGGYYRWMSYRSVKRVLGETNLEVKCLILFGASLLLLISGSFYWFGTKTEQLVDSQNPKRGQLLVDTLITLRHWETFERNEDFKPVVVELSDNLKSHDYDGGFIKTDATYICTTAGRTADSSSPAANGRSNWRSTHR